MLTLTTVSVIIGALLIRNSHKKKKEKQKNKLLNEQLEEKIEVTYL